MAITENWNIRTRAHACAATGETFADSAPFYTALFEDPASGDLVRKDYSLQGWAQAEAAGMALLPFSFWKSTYEPSKSESKPEVVEKEGAAALLRRLIEEDSAGSENTRYILAVMLERKKILRQTGTRDTEEASFLVYENPKNGEVYIIRDPELKLDQVEAVQKEVSLLLSTPGMTPPAEPTPAGTGTAAPEPESIAAQPEPDASPDEQPTTETSTPETSATDVPDVAAVEEDCARHGDIASGPPEGSSPIEVPHNIPA